MNLFISAPPKNAAISGPDIIHHNDEFSFECSIDGGNPKPEITWTLRDHLGQTKETAGENIDPGHSRMVLKTGSNERMLTINCVGENNQGIVSHTMHVQTQCKFKNVFVIYLTFFSTRSSQVCRNHWAHFSNPWRVCPFYLCHNSELSSSNIKMDN